MKVSAPVGLGKPRILSIPGISQHALCCPQITDIAFVALCVSPISSATDFGWQNRYIMVRRSLRQVSSLVRVPQAFPCDGPVLVSHSVSNAFVNGISELRSRTHIATSAR